MRIAPVQACASAHRRTCTCQSAAGCCPRETELRTINAASETQRRTKNTEGPCAGQCPPSCCRILNNRSGSIMVHGTCHFLNQLEGSFLPSKRLRQIGLAAVLEA